jgi:YhcH/YjgK/YiaL family protein
MKTIYFYKRRDIVMIFDRIENASPYYGIGEGIEKGLRFLKETDLDSLEIGRHEIDGDKLFILVQEYEPKDLKDASYEAHKRYIDIQYITEGKELMGYCPLNKLEVTKEYDEVKDITRLQGTGSFCLAEKDSFLIFFPEDGHMPGVATEDKTSVRKIVVKIRA